MKQRLFLAVMLAGLCATAQQPSQPKTNDQPAPTQENQNATQPDKNAAQPQPEQGAQSSDKDKDKDKAAPATAAAPAGEKAKGCLAVKPIGSHAFRNIMLAGVAGAIISKQQYKVTDVADYPVQIGTKYHGNDLQTISQNGTKVVILDKNVKDDVASKACH
jgi:hypothetical protein